MNEYLFTLFTKYKKKGILVDTNILLLYLVGSLDINMIKDFSRTEVFDEKDFDLVSKFIDKFDVKITTPHILTEASDLMGNRNGFQYLLKTFINLAEEKFISSLNVSLSESFLKFGVADSAILETSKGSHLIFTDDRPLFGYLINKGIDAVSLDQVRMI